MVFLPFNFPIPPIPIPRPPIGIEEINWPEWIYLLPWGIVPLLFFLFILSGEGKKITVNLALCTVNINGLKVLAVYDRFDSRGLGLSLFYNTHPSLEGKYIILPDGKVVFAYIWMIVTAQPPLGFIEDTIQHFGSINNYFNSLSYYNPLFGGSTSFPWPLVYELWCYGQIYDLTTGQAGSFVHHLTYEKYIRENVNNAGPPGHHTVRIVYNFREYWFFSARIHPTLNR